MKSKKIICTLIIILNLFVAVILMSNKYYIAKDYNNEKFENSILLADRFITSDYDVKNPTGETTVDNKNYEKTTVTLPEQKDITECKSLLGDPNDSNPPSPAYLLTYAFKVIRYVAIILLIGLTIMDFVSSVSSQDADSLKKSVNKAIKRTILCVIIFILPSLIEYILSVIHKSSVGICVGK